MASDGQAKDMERPALGCIDRGWAVFPCGAKRTPLTTHGFKDASRDEADVLKWLRKFPDMNLGVATGRVSGFVVIDVDPRNGGVDSLEQIENEHGELPVTPTAITGQKGWHYYFAYPAISDDMRVKTRAHFAGMGIDAKADGGYVIAPPSRHECGGCYNWDVGRHPDDTPLAELPGWAAAALVAKIDESADKRMSPRHVENCCMSKGLVDIDKRKIDEAIASAAAGGSGLRNGRILKYVRYLKSFPELAHITGDAVVQLLPLAEEYHRQMEHMFSGTDDITVTRAEFEYAWRNAKYPVGEGPLFDAAADAAKHKEPKMAQRYPEGTKARKLVCLCHELQRRAERDGKTQFYLAAQPAAEVLDLSRRQAGRLLAMLCRDGAIELMQKGKPGRASFYRYVGGAADESKD